MWWNIFTCIFTNYGQNLKETINFPSSCRFRNNCPICKIFIGSTASSKAFISMLRKRGCRAWVPSFECAWLLIYPIETNNIFYFHLWWSSFYLNWIGNYKGQVSTEYNCHCEQNRNMHLHLRNSIYAQAWLDFNITTSLHQKFEKCCRDVWSWAR